MNSSVPLQALRLDGDLGSLGRECADRRSHHDACAKADIDAARRALDIRLRGAYTAAKYAATHLRPGGSIVLSTGIAGARPEPNWTVAASICGALDALTRALAVELAPVRVNAVSPGVVRSNLWRDMSEQDRWAMYDSLSEALPVGRVGEVGDIAETFLYLMRNRLQQWHHRHGRRRLGARLTSSASSPGVELANTGRR